MKNNNEFTSNIYNENASILSDLVMVSCQNMSNKFGPLTKLLSPWQHSDKQTTSYIKHFLPRQTQQVNLRGQLIFLMR